MLGETYDEVQLRSFICADLVWLWQNAAWYTQAHISNYHWVSMMKVTFITLWTVSIPSLIAIIYNQFTKQFNLAQLLYIAKNIIMIVLCILRTLNYFFDIIDEHHYKQWPELIEMATSILFFAWGAYCGVQLIRNKGQRNQWRVVRSTESEKPLASADSETTPANGDIEQNTDAADQETVASTSNTTLVDL